MNWIGLVAALATFFSIWFGHVAVRKIEFISATIWVPATTFAGFGLIAELLSLSTGNHPLSTAFGILGITLLFDALEFIRQQNRIKRGHAPANPKNARHAKILNEHPAATMQDLLKRDPAGHMITME
jgi:hypothetical protein